MIEPTRLCEGEPNGFDAALIRAGRREAPSFAARKAAAAAGLSGAVLTSKASATGMAFKGIAGAAVKGMLAGALLTSVIVVVPRVVAQRTSASVVAPASSHLVPSPIASVERAPEPVAAAPAEIAPIAGARKRPPGDVPAAPPQNSTTPVVASSSRLAEEVRAFEQAEASFRRGEVAAAVAALDRYDRDFARGALAPEAEVLRIELLDAQGHGAAARARARAFLAARPEAPAARRLRNLIARGDDRRHE